MSGLAKLLIVEDDTSLAHQYKWLFKKDHEVTLASTKEGAFQALSRRKFQVLLLDLGLPPHPEDPTVGLSVLEHVVDTYPALKVIVLTAHGDRETAQKALSTGAYDFLVKPVDDNLLSSLIKRAFYRQKLEAEFWKEREYDLPVPMVVVSEAMQKVIQHVREIAVLPVSCIVLGETGTGKDLVAHLIHCFSPRKNKPLVAVECSSIPLTLGEAELFGSEKGSYTGSTARREGRIRQAEKGTLFLDEVGELSLELQAKLLRFLESREFTPVGGKTNRADVRVIAATNRNLSEEVERGRFRLDLYHRLCEIEITLPPLRERPREIVPLAEHFLAKLGHEFRMTPPLLTAEAKHVLEHYDFPGNIRELKNLISRAMILSRGRPIGRQEIGIAESDEPENKTISLNGEPGFNLPEARTTLEREWIMAALKRNGGNISQAASDLSVPRPTLYDLLKKHGLQQTAVC